MEKREDQFKNLFEKTSDEIFMEFLKKQKNKIFFCIGLSLTTIIVGTYYWYLRNENEKYINQEINVLVKKKQNKEKINFDKVLFLLNKSKKVSYKSTLLMLIDLKNISSKEWLIFLKEVKKIPYVCQYIHTTSHFKKFSYITELLFLKTLYFMGKKNYISEMKNFFMEKKMNTSIMSNYMYLILVLFTKDKFILDDIITSYKYTVTNLPIDLFEIIDVEHINE